MMLIPKKMLIIDCLALAHRCYWTHKNLKTSDGRGTGVVYGAKGFMENLLMREQPDYVIAATDPGGRTFRHDMYEAYKANRKEKDPEMVAQLEDYYTMFEKMDIPFLKVDGYEADDIIGSLAKKFASDDLHVYIVSYDKDFMQCVNKNVFLYKAGKETSEIIGENEVLQKTGVRPSQIIDILALQGDVADNIPGVRGIGEKRAEKLVKSFGSVEGVYENLHHVSGPVKVLQSLHSSRANADLSKKLATIDTNMTLSVTLEEAKYELKPMSQKLKDFYKELEIAINE